MICYLSSCVSCNRLICTRKRKKNLKEVEEEERRRGLNHPERRGRDSRAVPLLAQQSGGTVISGSELMSHLRR